MNGANLRSLHKSASITKGDNKVKKHTGFADMKKKSSDSVNGLFGNAYFMKWTAEDLLGVVRHHPIPCVFAAALLFFMGVEYTLYMVPSTAPPFDLGFVATVSLHRLLESRPALNTILAGLNTVRTSTKLCKRFNHYVPNSFVC